MSKLTDLTEVTTLADGDLAMAVDVSNTSMDATGTNSKVTLSNVYAYIKTKTDTLYAAVLGADDNYVTDAEKIVIGNTSGTNTGDNATNTQYSGLDSAKVDKATYDAHSVLYATTDNTPVALTVGEQTLVGRATGGNISAIAIDSDLSSVSANDDTVPSAKATKAMGDLKALLAGSTSQAFSVSQLEVSNTDTTITRSAAGVLAVEGVVIPSISSTNIITNKRNQPRVYSAANNASLTPEIDTYDIFHLTAMSAATTINNHSTSTPADGELMEFRFLDNATPRALTWGTAYVAKAGVALPTTTTTSKNLVCLFEYNSNLTKWNLLSSGLEA